MGHWDRLVLWYSLSAHELSSPVLVLCLLAWLRCILCKRSSFFGVPSLTSPGAGLLLRGLYYLVTCLFIYLFIFVSSTEPSVSSVMGALVGFATGGGGGGLWLGFRLGQASWVFEYLEVWLWLQLPGPLGTWSPLATRALTTFYMKISNCQMWECVFQKISIILTTHLPPIEGVLVFHDLPLNV